MTAQLLGYARTSTPDQTADLQLDALAAAGCAQVFIDVASGAKTDRPELERLLGYARAGDTVVVWRLDRLGRSLRHLLDTVTDLEQRGVGFRSLTESIDTTTPAGRLVFHLFGALAEFERELLRERTQAGLSAARARGRVGGRPPALSGDKLALARSLYDSRLHTVSAIARMLGVGRATVYRAMDAAAPLKPVLPLEPVAPLP